MSLTIGQRAIFTKTITESDVIRFAEISGDSNPLHVDENYARKTRFGARVAHGALTFALISTVIGSKLPGPGSIYVKQTLEFLKPVYLNDTITATAEITAIQSDKRRVTLKTECANQRGEKVANGEAVILYPDTKTGSGA